MADQQNDPHDDKVTTVPLPAEEPGGADRVIIQENQSPEVAVGGGEWPSPDAPPEGPSPGATPAESGAGGEGRTAARQADDVAGGDGNDAEFPPMREVLDADPVAAGSQSVPEDDDDGGQRWGADTLG